MATCQHILHFAQSSGATILPTSHGSTPEVHSPVLTGTVITGKMQDCICSVLTRCGQTCGRSTDWIEVLLTSRRDKDQAAPKCNAQRGSAISFFLEKCMHAGPSQPKQVPIARNSPTIKHASTSALARDCAQAAAVAPDCVCHTHIECHTCRVCRSHMCASYRTRTGCD